MANPMPSQNAVNDNDLDLGTIKRPHENPSNMNKSNAQGVGGDALHTSATNKSEDVAFKGPPPNNSDPQLQLQHQKSQQ